MPTRTTGTIPAFTIMLTFLVVLLLIINSFTISGYNQCLKDKSNIYCEYSECEPCPPCWCPNETCPTHEEIQNLTKCLLKCGEPIVD
jgi:hypothetical protein